MSGFDSEVVARRQHVRAGATAGRRGPIAVDAGDAARLVEVLAALDAVAAGLRGLPGVGSLCASDLDGQIAELRAILGIEASGG